MDAKHKRCVVYTRKSSEEGLDQAFNSLDAQFEAGTAFIQSQKQEGWFLLDGRYDDGGFSGGTMVRPALKRLLDDVEAGFVDIIVVYKVDRLTRSLADFAKLVEIFDKHNVSFISVTQQFNTTSSMGRLTLNVLLSFAQYEREVTAERIRDKVAASKKKGIWMGGTPPLGYLAQGGELSIIEEEANLVRLIFAEFISIGSITQLCKQLATSGHRTKTFISLKGNRRGGRAFVKTDIYKILHNRTYLGETRHKDQWYPGLHHAIVDQALWNKVHATLKQPPSERTQTQKYQTAAPLKGILFGPDAKAMTPTHTKQNGKTYRYYLTHTAAKKSHAECPIRMVPASEIEHIVFGEIKAIFSHPTVITQTAQAALIQDDRITEDHVREQLLTFDTVWSHLFPEEKARMVQLLVHQVHINIDGISITFKTHGLTGLVADMKYEAQQLKRIAR
jgi:site-specific DNA recombinase